jgi:hypothetical protein
MRYQFKEGDGVVCESQEQLCGLLKLAADNGFRFYGSGFSDRYDCLYFNYSPLTLTPCCKIHIKNKISVSDFTALVTGKLPKYWCFDIREYCSDKALTYLNKKYGSKWSGKGQTYYGFDGNNYDKDYRDREDMRYGTDCHASIDMFQNKPFLLPVQYILDAIKQEFVMRYPLRPCECLKSQVFDCAKYYAGTDPCDANNPVYISSLVKRFTQPFTILENSFKTKNKPMAQKITRENLRVIWDLLSADMQVVLTKRMTDNWDKNEIEVSDDEARSILLRYDIESKNYKELSRYFKVEKPKYVPFDFSDADKLIGNSVIYKPTKRYFSIIAVVSDGVAIGTEHHSFKSLFENFIFSDTTICGKLSK